MSSTIEPPQEEPSETLPLKMAGQVVEKQVDQYLTKKQELSLKEALLEGSREEAETARLRKEIVNIKFFLTHAGKVFEHVRQALKKLDEK